MSLLALAGKLGTRQSSARTLLLYVVIIGAVIVGLLAMHSLNEHAATVPTHHAATSHSEGTSGSHAEEATAVALDAHPQGVSAEDCADCGSGHSMLMMACVLVLLAVLLLFGQSPSANGWLNVLLRAKSPPTPRALSFSAPPSLTRLCISRT